MPEQAAAGQGFFGFRGFFVAQHPQPGPYRQRPLVAADRHQLVTPLPQMRHQLAELAREVLVDQQDAQEPGLEIPSGERYVAAIGLSGLAMDPVPASLLFALGLPQAGAEPLQRALELCGAPALAGHSIPALHQRALAEAGTSWQATRSLAVRWFGSEVVASFSQQLREALLAQRPEQGLRVIQLPGLERLLPLWQQALAATPLQPAYVLLLRHPLEVAEALRRSHGWSRDRALLVWLQSTLAMEGPSRGQRRVVIEQERLHWDPDGALHQLEQRLGLQLPERSHQRLLQWEQEQSDTAAASGRVPELQAVPEGSPLLQMALELHGWLQAEARDQQRPRLMPEVICQQLAWAEALYGRTLVEEQQQRQRAEAELHQLQGRRLVRLSRWLRRERAA